MYTGINTVDALISAVAIDVPGIGEYLDSRFIQNSFDTSQNSHRSFTSNAREILKIRDGDDCTELEAGLVNIHAWCSEKIMTDALFEKTGNLKPYKMLYFDLPLIST